MPLARAAAAEGEAPSGSKEEPAHKEEAPKKEENRPGIKPAPGAPAYLAVPLFVIPVIEGGQVTRTVSVGIGLELVKGKTLDDVKPKENELINAFFQELYGLFGQRASADRVAQASIIKARLMRVADRILGPGIVQQVLILQLFERPKVA
ncbi:MAG TPA: flagellar basal body-associated FliL family protein [Stellaceae bacterium]|nr:flagellar basal body-associated FliL family protein [Stellaceae bacterium]